MNRVVVDREVESVDREVKSVDRQVESVDREVESVVRRVESVDRRVESVVPRVESVDRVVEGVDGEVESVDLVVLDVAVVHGNEGWVRDGVVQIGNVGPMGGVSVTTSSPCTNIRAESNVTITKSIFPFNFNQK